MLYLIGGSLTAIVLVSPLLWAVFRSFQPNSTIIAPPSAQTFWDLGWENYQAIFSNASGIFRATGNSLIVSVSTAVLTALIATMAGYGFAKFKLPGGGVLFGMVLLSMMIPFQAILTPLYLELNALGLTDSLLGLVLFYTTVNLPFGVFVMRNSFTAIPSDLEDSAFVDGAGTIRLLSAVLRPLWIPGAATAALYAFLMSWTEFLGALTFLTQQGLYTLPIALLNIQSGTYGQVNFGYLVAGSVIAMIPCTVLYIALQKFYVRGLASGALKG